MIRNIFLVALLVCTNLIAQDDDLLAGIEEEVGIERVSASFKANRVINSHSLKNTNVGVLDFKVQHRFGFVNTGIDELFGLDQSTVRLGFDYGVTEDLQVGFGRSTFQKTLDAYIKYRVLHQCASGCNTPITATLVAGIYTDTRPFADTTRENFFSSRLAYNFQLILGRKFSDKFSLQLMPGVIHRNLVTLTVEENDVINIGIAGRYKLSNRVALNGEYFYVLPDQLLDIYTNSLSVGLDIETGGHVFQVHLSNSTGMFERAFITETVGEWSEGDIHFGFNISRVFTLKKRKKKTPS